MLANSDTWYDCCEWGKGVWLNRQYYRFGAHINCCIIRIAPMPNTLPENLSIRDTSLNRYKKRNFGRQKVKVKYDWERKVRKKTIKVDEGLKKG